MKMHFIANEVTHQMNRVNNTSVMLISLALALITLFIIDNSLFQGSLSTKGPEQQFIVSWVLLRSMFLYAHPTLQVLRIKI